MSNLSFEEQMQKYSEDLQKAQDTVAENFTGIIKKKRYVGENNMILDFTDYTKAQEILAAMEHKANEYRVMSFPKKQRIVFTF
jgi:hypothetical protein